MENKVKYLVLALVLIACRPGIVKLSQRDFAKAKVRHESGILCQSTSFLQVDSGYYDPSTNEINIYGRLQYEEGNEPIHNGIVRFCTDTFYNNCEVAAITDTNGQFHVTGNLDKNRVLMFKADLQEDLVFDLLKVTKKSK